MQLIHVYQVPINKHLDCVGLDFQTSQMVTKHLSILISTQLRIVNSCSCYGKQLVDIKGSAEKVWLPVFRPNNPPTHTHTHDHMRIRTCLTFPSDSPDSCCVSVSLSTTQIKMCTDKILSLVAREKQDNHQDHYPHKCTKRAVL